MTLDKKQIWVIFFLPKFKMGHKAVETTHNVNSALCPGTANKNIHALHYSAVVVQEILQRRWEPWIWEAQWLATGSWQWPTKWIIEADPLTRSQEMAEELNANPSKRWTICEANWKGEKTPQVGASWADHKSKVHHFEVSSSLILCNNEPFLDQTVTWGEKWILSNNQQWLDCSSVVGPKSSKALPKPKLVPKKGQGHCLAVCCQSDQLQISESWRNHYIWEGYSAADRWDASKTALPTANTG